MQTEIIIAGFGGQGVLFAGQVLAYAAMDNGKEVTWIPSYGPEMRGGTANCTVIIADEEIGSPIVRNPQAVIAMNQPSTEKYEPLVSENGILIINSSLVDKEIERSDLRRIEIPANEIAESLGDRRMTNVVMVGALLTEVPVLTIESIEKTLEDHLPDRHKNLLPLNFQALREGAEFVRKERAGQQA
ncbi:MAG: 2-oxoacid:acceptor oxidoreductase family protein [Anaerolineales bacterium]|jgi:2-oxoglutarate ferredoxin oxidoreductase subunit gamma